MKSMRLVFWRMAQEIVESCMNWREYNRRGIKAVRRGHNWFCVEYLDENDYPLQRAFECPPTSMDDAWGNIQMERDIVTSVMWTLQERVPMDIADEFHLEQFIADELQANKIGSKSL